MQIDTVVERRAHHGERVRWLSTLKTLPTASTSVHAASGRRVNRSV